MMKTNSYITVILTNHGIDNCIFTFSSPAKPTYSRTIMGRSQKQQQVRSTVGGIRLTGAPQPPLKASGRLHQTRPFQRYPGSGKAQNQVETQTKQQIRESWLQRLRPRTRAASKHNN